MSLTNRARVGRAVVLRCPGVPAVDIAAGPDAGERGATPMSPPDPTTAVESWHAHVHFDARRRDAAWALREVIVTALAGRIETGRFHERPVGPHPMGSYQLAFVPAQFAAVLGA